MWFHKKINKTHKLLQSGGQVRSLEFQSLGDIFSHKIVHRVWNATAISVIIVLCICRTILTHCVKSANPKTSHIDGKTIIFETVS